MVYTSNYTTLVPQLTKIKPIHKCEILTLRSDFSICWTKMCTGEETLHILLTEIYWIMAQTIQYS